MITDALVLVVDDQDAPRFAKVQTLRRAGLRVAEATTGRDAIDLVAALRPDVVLLDVNLPDVSGFEVCRRLRAGEGALPSLQIMQVSNTAVAVADQVRGLQGGADAYLAEPVDAAVLVATVQALLRVRRAETALASALDREREAREAAEEASRLKDEFIATLSHELRTPLNALMGWVWQLRHAELSETARDRALASLERNATLQAQLINDLLDLSRSARGKLRLEMHVLDLRAAIDMAVDSMKDAAARKQVAVRVSGDSEAVIADAARLQQILGNLLTNAIQFTPAGGAIDVSLASDRTNAVIAVADTGAGIDPAFLPHVFDQFRQGEGGLTRKHGGLGLGLAVVRQLVELHGGRITASSRGVGQGTTFTVKLPREDVVKERPDGRPVLADVRVLVVDVDAAGTEMLSATLESSGALVTPANFAAGDGVLTGTNEAALIVCGEGIDEAGRRRIVREARDANPEIPTLAIAAATPPTDYPAAADGSFDAVVVRPYAPADIVRAAAHVLGNRRGSDRFTT